MFRWIKGSCKSLKVEYRNLKDRIRNNLHSEGTINKNLSQNLPTPSAPSFVQQTQLKKQQQSPTEIWRTRPRTTTHLEWITVWSSGVFFRGTSRDILENSTPDVDGCFSGTLSETNRKCAEPCGGLSALLLLLLLQVGWRFPVWCHATLLYIKACGDSLLSYIGMHKTLPHFYFDIFFFFDPHLSPPGIFSLICFHQKCTGYLLLLFKLFQSIYVLNV